MVLIAGKQMRQSSIGKQVPVGIHMSRPRSHRVTPETLMLCLQRNVHGSTELVVRDKLFRDINL